jgi:hypothetical protein
MGLESRNRKSFRFGACSELYHFLSGMIPGNYYLIPNRSNPGRGKKQTVYTIHKNELVLVRVKNFPYNTLTKKNNGIKVNKSYPTFLSRIIF